MLEIILKGHDNYYGIADVVRSFYIHPVEDKDHGRVFCEDAPDVRLISSIADGRTLCYSSDGKIDIVLEPVTEPFAPGREVKRSVYLALSQIADRKMPWGCLTGIRPTLVAGEEDDWNALASKYFVREDKARLAIETYHREQEILDMIPKEDLNVYVGIPFCPSRCEYCSFVSSDISHHMGRLGSYLDALEEELKTAGPAIDRKIRTLYLGGGTPTVFCDDDYDRLMDIIFSNLDIGPDTEITVEAGRPDTITEHKLMTMKERGIRRICINPQTMNSGTLMKLNRRHSAEDTRRVYQMARDIGFDVINMDLIAGLKYESAGELINSLEELTGMEPENITIHTLYKKRRASISVGEVMSLGTDDVDEAVSRGYEILKNAGYRPYYMYRQKDTGHGLENTGFARPGTECLYNVAMMTDARDVLSFGAGGMSKRVFEQTGHKYRVERCPCIKDVIGYIGKSREMAERKMRFFGIM